MRVRAPAACALALVLAAACGDTTHAGDGAVAPVPSPAALGPAEAQAPPAAAAPAVARPSVLLVSCDTLGARHLSLYGHAPRTSPQLEEFAATATVFHAARATSPWTLPSHASLFTGLYPFEHGAHRYPDTGEDEAAVLADGHLTLAEALAADGYRTGAVVANGSYLHPHFGLGQGFELYEVQDRRAEAVFARVLELVDALPAGQPWLLFANTMDTHQPYDVTPRAGFPDPGSAQEAHALTLAVRAFTKDDDQALVDDALERLHAHYDLAVANLDAALGRLFDGLRERGLFDELLVVVTSDHGEMFGEHGLIEHGRDVHEELLHVPLLVKAPGQRTRVDDHDPISLAHLPGLVLQHVALRSEPPGLQALRRHWPRAELLAENHLYPPQQPWSRGDRFAPLARVRRALYSGTHKLVDSSDGQDALHDLGNDPGERDDLRSRRPELARELERRLLDLLGTRTAEPPELITLDPELEQRLRALGYLEDG